MTPVAWRVKDFADGWFVVTDENNVKSYEADGFRVEPLYAAADVDLLSNMEKFNGEQWELCIKERDYAERRIARMVVEDARNADLERLREIAALARELVSPSGMVNRGVDRGLVVVEKADKSDPHYRLCVALEKLEAIQ